MQNKGLVKFFAILFALVSIYQLSFTFVANKVKSDAKSFAGNNPDKEIKYLDSIGKEKVFSLGFTDFTYNEVKDKQINKGLDLEGGINVILQISVKDVLKGLSNNSKNPIFNKALEDAKTNQKGNQSYLDAFYEAFDNNSKGTVKLASPDIFANRNLQGEIDFNMTDAQVKKVLAKKVDESVESAFGVLRSRIDKFGVTQPNIAKLGQTGRILIELPGAKDVDRIKKLVSSKAELEFWETYKAEELMGFLGSANEALKATVKKDEKVVETKPADSISKLLTDKDKDTTAAKKGNNPLFDKFVSQGGGPVLLIALSKDTATINGYLKRQEIRALLPADKRYAKFVWGKGTVTVDEKTKKETETVDLYALKGNRDGIAPLSGGVIVDARDTFDQMGKPAVSMQMNGAGAKKMGRVNRKSIFAKKFYCHCIR